MELLAIEKRDEEGRIINYTFSPSKSCARARFRDNLLAFVRLDIQSEAGN